MRRQNSTGKWFILEVLLATLFPTVLLLFSLLEYGPYLLQEAFSPQTNDRQPAGTRFFDLAIYVDFFVPIVVVWYATLNLYAGGRIMKFIFVPIGVVSGAVASVYAFEFLGFSAGLLAVVPPWLVSFHGSVLFFWEKARRA